MSETKIPFKERIKQKAQQLKIEAKVLLLGMKDPRTPWYARAFGFLIIGYALSPIDLIPDFIPVIGYLDDLIIIPLAILLIRKMVPKEVLEESRKQINEGGK